MTIDNRWPDWNKPATKGDVIRGLIYVRSCVVDLSICAAALSKNDLAKFRESFAELQKDDSDLSRLIDEIGGAALDE